MDFKLDDEGLERLAGRHRIFADFNKFFLINCHFLNMRPICLFRTKRGPVARGSVRSRGHYIRPPQHGG